MSIYQELIDASKAFLNWFNNSYIEFGVSVNYLVTAGLVRLYGTGDDVKPPPICFINELKNNKVSIFSKNL